MTWLYLANSKYMNLQYRGIVTSHIIRVCFLLPPYSIEGVEDRLKYRGLQWIVLGILNHISIWPWRLDVELILCFDINQYNWSIVYILNYRY